jgi:hypothetical protein
LKRKKEGILMFEKSRRNRNWKISLLIFWRNTLEPTGL